MSVQSKRERELSVFRSFAIAAGLPIQDDSIEPCEPPYPDVRCTIAPGGVRFFELGEVLWKVLWEETNPAGNAAGLAHGLAISEHRSRRKAELLASGQSEEAEKIITAGSFGYPPLMSLVQMIEKKATRNYETGGHPSSLLLYYERQSPVEPFDLLVGELATTVRDLISATPFEDVWLYHHEVAYSFPMTRAFAAGQPVPLKRLLPSGNPAKHYRPFDQAPTGHANRSRRNI